MGFELHPRLAGDTCFVADWPLCRVLLMEDARYFWLILVPRIYSTPSAGGARPVTEITDLSIADRRLLIEEVARAGTIIKEAGAAKLNIGALGNQVAQLHLHVIGRNPGDPAWPGPVWGHGTPQAYEPTAREDRLALVRAR